MNKISYLVVLIMLLSACKKDKGPQPTIPLPHPLMQYSNLHNESILFGQQRAIDINNDGSVDFVFRTQLVGDPVFKLDRKQFHLASKVEAYLLHDPSDQTPVLNKGDQVSIMHNGHQWFHIADIIVAEKIIPLNGASFWRGRWQDAVYKYLAVQVKKNGNVYNGWIELSFDSVLEKLVLHRAAICTEPGITIKA